VCFAYPKGKFVDAPTFNAGTFSVAEIKQATTEEGLSERLTGLGYRPAWERRNSSHQWREV
jgi:hypothetical protein